MILGAEFWWGDCEKTDLLASSGPKGHSFPQPRPAAWEPQPLDCWRANGPAIRSRGERITERSALQALVIEGDDETRAVGPGWGKVRPCGPEASR